MAAAFLIEMYGSRESKQKGKPEFTKRRNALELVRLGMVTEKERANVVNCPQGLVSSPVTVC